MYERRDNSGNQKWAYWRWPEDFEFPSLSRSSPCAFVLILMTDGYIPGAVSGYILSSTKLLRKVIERKHDCGMFSNSNIKCIQGGSS